MRLLIADDDLVSSRVLEKTLRRWGYETICVGRGDDAFAVLQSQDRPSLAILDWMMPGMSGVEICRELIKKESRNPAYLILLTAMGNRNDLVTGLQSGADDYITKPFDPDELKARIRVGERVIGLRNRLAAQVQELESALTHVKMLQGILPICAHCHSIRDDRESWRRMEEYIEGHSEAQFSHGVCPACMERHYPEPK